MGCFKISTPFFTQGFDMTALKAILQQTAGDVTLSIKPAADLPAPMKPLVGTRPAFSFAMTCVKNGKTVSVDSLSKGRVSYWFAYTPAAGEAPGALFSASLSGSVGRIAKSCWDENGKGVIFASNAFSSFGVGYQAPASAPKDISSHRAKDAMDFALVRGYMNETVNGAFSPDEPITRAELAKTLAKFANADVSAYNTGSFDDVKADDPNLPYIEWAAQKGVIFNLTGAASKQFNPNKTVTREEFAVFLRRVVSVTNFILPDIREYNAGFISGPGINEADNVSRASMGAVEALGKAGIIVDKAIIRITSRFLARDAVTRGEVAAALYRYVKVFVDPTTALGFSQNDSGQLIYYDKYGREAHHYLHNGKLYLDIDYKTYPAD